jgi:hypothetical protein
MHLETKRIIHRVLVPLLGNFSGSNKPFNPGRIPYLYRNQDFPVMKCMLPFSLIISILAAFFSHSCSTSTRSPIEGTWRLAYEYEVKAGNSTRIFPGTSMGSELKMWTGDRWSLVGVFFEDSVMTDNYAGGTFSLEGNDYREMVEFHSAPEYLGQTVRLYLEIREDTLVQIWPVNEAGEPDPEHHYMEKWVRMKQGQTSQK